MLAFQCAVCCVQIEIVAWNQALGRTKEFLVVLEKLSKDGAEQELYKDNLNDAIEGTRDAMNDAEKAKKKVAPPPVRRKN